MRLNEISNYAEFHDADVQGIVQEYRNILHEYLMGDKLIYRGFRMTDKEAFVADGSGMNRKAANTTNYTNMLTGVLSSWTNWPDRSKSFICSFSRNYASSYGKTFIVVPLENQPIAVCDYEDFWESLPSGDLRDTFDDVSSYNRYLEDILRFYLTKINLYSENSDASLPNNTEGLDNNPKELFHVVDSLIKYLSSLDKKILSKTADSVRGDYGGARVLAMFEAMIHAGSAKVFFNTILNPAENNKLYKNFSDVKSASGEVWLSGKILAFQESLLDDVSQAVFG